MKDLVVADVQDGAVIASPDEFDGIDRTFSSSSIADALKEYYADQYDALMYATHPMLQGRGHISRKIKNR